MSKMNYGQAINNAHRMLLESDNRVFVMGQGVNSPWFVGNTTTGLINDFGSERIIDTPVSEAAVTGAAIGAAMAGMRPIVFHPRMDFMYLALDQIINHCAQWNYLFDGKVNVPVTIRGIINRGGEQSAQHSQSPFSIYAHIPGLKIVCPATPSDAKGLLIAAVRDDNPVLYVDDRWLYSLEDDVPDEMFATPIGRSAIRRDGSDITIVAFSYLAKEACIAAEILAEKGISAEVVDLRTIKPLDMATVVTSLKKTGKLVICDPEWPYCNVAGTICAYLTSEEFGILKQPVQLVQFPDAPIGAATSLEQAFYPMADNIVRAVLQFNN